MSPPNGQNKAMVTDPKDLKIQICKLPDKELKWSYNRTGTQNEKCVTGQFHHSANITECTYTNIDGTGQSLVVLS